MWLPQFALTKQRFDARKIFPGGPQLGDRLGLPGRELKAKPEYLFGELVLPRGKLGRILIAQLFDPARH
jgi:hypothetical protein